MIQFIIPGTPQGKGRARSFVRGKHVGHYTPEKTRTYEGMIRTQALAEMGMRPATTLPVKLDLIIGMPVPASWPSWKSTAALNGEIVPTTKPDADNVAKAIKDALNGVCWYDDAQVVLLSVQKIYTQTPGVSVSVVALTPCPAQIKKRGELAA
jgi:Holliday junction resolvase RusA-like endonuclease